jgi:hypothetical protein
MYQGSKSTCIRLQRRRKNEENKWIRGRRRRRRRITRKYTRVPKVHV